jgi:hypothetical protein
MFRLQVCQFCKQSRLNLCIGSHGKQNVFKSMKSAMKVFMFPCFMLLREDISIQVMPTVDES